MFVDFFIKRPVFATVCAMVIVLAGAISIPTLPIAELPDLAPPQVIVSSTYIGANAQAVESAVTIPLEQAVNGVDFGLTGSIWTRDLDTAHRAARRIHTGYVWLNNASQHFMGAPFGGVKQSGIGREECFAELLEFTYTKNVNLKFG